MDEMVYNVFHQLEWGFPIALYFFVGGLSAGSFVTSAVAALYNREEYKPIVMMGGTLALALILLTPFILIVDLEQPARFWHLFVPTYINITSFVGWGTIFLMLYGLMCILYFHALRRGYERRIRILAAVGIPMAMSVGTYTGYVIAVVQGRALWNITDMPVLFMVSAMISGLALVLGATILKYKYLPTKGKINDQVLHQLGLLLGFFIILDWMLLVADMYVALVSGVEESMGALLLLRGELSGYFFGVQVFLGGMLPLVLLLSPGINKSFSGKLIAAFFVLVGTLTMRYLVLMAGQGVPLS
jgi:formate-dependent nitrite reductase membrane component NrfD